MNEDDDDDEEEVDDWDGDAETWTKEDDDAEEDVKDESAAYLEFLTEEVPKMHRLPATLN